MKEPDFYKYFNLKKVSDKLKIQYDKVNNNFKARYDSFSDSDRNNIARLMIPQVEKFFARLGYSIAVTKNKD